MYGLGESLYSHTHVFMDFFPMDIFSIDTTICWIQNFNCCSEFSVLIFICTVTRNGIVQPAFFYYYHYYYLDFNILCVFDQNKAKPSIKTVKINLCYLLAVVHSYHRVTDKLNCHNTILSLTQPMHLSLSVVQNFKL